LYLPFSESMASASELNLISDIRNSVIWRKDESKT